MNQKNKSLLVSAIKTQKIKGLNVNKRTPSLLKVLIFINVLKFRLICWIDPRSS